MHNGSNNLSNQLLYKQVPYPTEASATQHSTGHYTQHAGKQSLQQAPYQTSTYVDQPMQQNPPVMNSSGEFMVAQQPPRNSQREIITPPAGGHVYATLDSESGPCCACNVQLVLFICGCFTYVCWIVGAFLPCCTQPYKDRAYTFWLRMNRYFSLVFTLIYIGLTVALSVTSHHHTYTCVNDVCVYRHHD